MTPACRAGTAAVGGVVAALMGAVATLPLNAQQGAEAAAAQVWFGDGRIRAEHGSDGLELTYMSVPSGFGSSAPREPRRVAFRWGKGSVTYTGRLTADRVDVYLVQARKGDLLNAQLERVAAGQASIRIVQDADERVLPASGPGRGTNPRLWAGPVPEAGRYRVEVVRRTAYCDPPVTYKVTISLR